MGYLDNSSITVDAILTKKGRELLAKGRDFFVISQFALADDEIDYELWNPAHPLGSDYYGIIIENMPIVEAVTDENYSLRYKLLTLAKNTIRIPIIQSNPSSISLEEGSQTQIVTLETKNGGNDTLGYTVKISEEAKDFIAEKGFDSKFGARPLKRAIQRYFEDPLSEEIINAQIKEGDTIKVSLHKDKSTLVMKINKPKLKVKKSVKKE